MMNTTNELLYRILFGFLWLLFFSVRLYYQRKVKNVGEYTHINKKQELSLFRLFALGHFVLVLYFLSPWLDVAQFSLPEWLRWGGGGITLLGSILFGWSHQSLGRNWTAILALSSSHELIIDGPYRFIRHPMYLAFFCIGFGFTMLSANWLVALGYLGPFSVMYFTRVTVEEKMMMDRFGEQYRRYMQQTGRLFPRIRQSS